MRVTAVAHSNIALVKYWGKRPGAGNLPAVGSISVTLDALKTTTGLQFDPDLKNDQFKLNGQSASHAQTLKVSRFLDRLAGSAERPKAYIESTNNFPTAAGLASSASGFAALTLAAASLLELDTDPRSLSKLARSGSGSSARSIYGGFVEMKCGSERTGKNDYAIQLYDEAYWDLSILIAIVSSDPKKTGSTEGMIQTADTSPFYPGWLESSGKDLSEMKEALAKKDFPRLGEIAEHSCLKMHGLMMSGQPPLLYWDPVTLESIHTIWGLRRQGIPVYFTIDAGPQVKAICLQEHKESVKQRLEAVHGISRIIEAKPGPGVYIENKINDSGE